MVPRRRSSLAGPRCRREQAPGHWFFDGWASARDQLRAAGVPRGSDLRRRPVHGEPPGRVLLVSRDGKRRPGRHRPRAIRRFRRVVHSRVGEPIGVGVQRAADVLERDAADLVREQPRPGVQRLQARVLHLELPSICCTSSSESERTCSVRWPCAPRPLERREQRRDTRRRCWWRRRSTRRTPRSACRRAARCGRRSRPGPGCRARRRRCTRRPVRMQRRTAGVLERARRWS